MKSWQIEPYAVMKTIAVAVLAVLVSASAAAAQNYYEVRDLGVLSGQTSATATDLNNSGTVVGRSGNRGFVYKECKMYDLGSLGGNETSAEAINKQGSIVGWSKRADGIKRAFYYSAGVMQDLGGDGKFDESASAISSWDLPAGVESVAGGLGASAVWYFNNKTIAMPSILVNPPSGFGFIQNVTDMNDILQVTGYFTSSQVGYVSAPGFGAWTKIQGIPGFGSAVVPFAINENGYVVGGAGWPYPHAFLSTDPNTPAKDLGTLGTAANLSVAQDINASGWVVGWSDKSSTSGPLAFLHNGTTMIDLNTRMTNGAGWHLIEATGINDGGQIIGNGTFNGQPRAFLLIPRRFPWGPITACIPPILTF